MLLGASYSHAQSLIGYFHNWQDANAPYVQLDQVDGRYTMIDVAFATPTGGTDYRMQFVPDQVSQGVFIGQILALQAQNKQVLISIGGATAPVSLDNALERDSFVASIDRILNTYGFDGMDIDLEGSSLSVSGGTIQNPVNAPIVNLIQAIRQIMADYRAQHGKKLLLTMAPETAFVQGGMSAYGGIWGAYLPVIHALRDSLDVLHVQLYNSGSMYGINGQVYTQGTADFIVAMCEAVIQGFNTTGGFFTGLPADKVAAGLPACALAAGGGYADTATVASAIRYLRGTGPKPGTYNLAQAGGYPNFRGLMTWSINWDAVANCGGAYSFAQNYEHLFGTNTGVAETVTNGEDIRIIENPVREELQVETKEESTVSIIDMQGQLMKVCSGKDILQVDVGTLKAGTYLVRIVTSNNCSTERFVKQ